MADAALSRRDVQNRAIERERMDVRDEALRVDPATGGGSSSGLPDNSVTYAKLQDVTATKRILGRKTAGAGDPEEMTLSEVLDFITSAAQGDILYRGAAAWARLPAGTSGHFLKTLGAGNDPVWAAAGGGAAAAGAQVGYARTESSTAVSTTSTFPLDTTIPQISEGAAVAAVDTTISPTNAASLLEVEVTISYASVDTTSHSGFALFRDSGADAIGHAFSALVGGSAQPIVLRAIVAAGSTSATTFKLRIGSQGGTGNTTYLLSLGGTNYFGAAGKIIMTVKEILQ